MKLDNFEKGAIVGYSCIGALITGMAVFTITMFFKEKKFQKICDERKKNFKHDPEDQKFIDEFKRHEAVAKRVADGEEYEAVTKLEKDDTYKRLCNEKMKLIDKAGDIVLSSTTKDSVSINDQSTSTEKIVDNSYAIDYSDMIKTIDRAIKDRKSYIKEMLKVNRTHDEVLSISFINDKENKDRMTDILDKMDKAIFGYMTLIEVIQYKLKKEDKS